jgi:phosphatidylserine decarboxylase
VFAPEGYPIIGAALALGAVLAAAGLWWGGVPGAVLVVLGVAAVAFTLYFFRDPDRTPPADADGLLLAPADGKVVEIVEDEEEPLYLKGKATRVSIFLSPLNVHVNRAPAKGQIEYERYVPGDYLVAWHPKASEKNERSELGLRHDGSGTKVLFKQIAGAVARRIVYYLSEGDRVEAGERFGLVKFGSRMDVIVPPSVEIQVQKGESVRGGESVLGALPVAPQAAPQQQREPAAEAAALSS